MAHYCIIVIINTASKTNSINKLCIYYNYALCTMYV